MKILDGKVLGGGVGVSIYNGYNIYTSESEWGMPEGWIGLVTDVGASYFLSRLNRRVGWYIATTATLLNPY